MATLLKIHSSMFNSGGQSSILTDRFADRWLARNPGGKVISRDLSVDPAPHLDAERFQAFLTAVNERTPAQQQVVAYSDALIEEL
jgi:FMN-dependent NADH-azoreductase